MKKLLIIILIVLVLALTIFTIVNGLEIGSFNILGISQIREKNEELDKVVTDATKLATSTFPSKINEVNTSMKKFQEKKQEYEEMVAVSDSSDVNAANHLSNYNLDFLWTRIGTHATNKGVNIDMALTQGTGGSNVYNINFTAEGRYSGIAEFIRAVEDDSDLGFKIEEFSMKAVESTDNLRATFVCKNIPIEGISAITGTSNTDTQGTGNTTNNTTNTTSTNNTTNTTNTTNKTNTATNTTANNTSTNAKSTNTTNTTNTTN